MVISELQERIETYLPHIQRKLLEGTYKSQPNRCVYIPKANGGVRLLGIAVLRDRIVQQAVLQMILPLIDPDFSDYSYGVRKGKSA